MQVLKVIKRDQLAPVPTGCTIIYDNTSKIKNLIMTHGAQKIIHSDIFQADQPLSQVIDPTQYPLGPYGSHEFNIIVPGNYFLHISEYNLLKSMPVINKKKLLLDTVDEKSRELLNLIIDMKEDVRYALEQRWKGPNDDDKRAAFIAIFEAVAEQGKKMRDKWIK